MSKIAPNMVQNPINNMYSSYKPRDNEERINDDDHRTKGMSFLALVFFVFFYVCIFSVFNFSVCNVVNDGRFLFFLSNTLVMILAADYSAFASSSSKVMNVYESYGKVPVHRNELVELPVATYVEVDDTKEECVVDAPPVTARREVVKLLTYYDDSCVDIGADDDEEGKETIEKDEQVVEKTEEQEDDDEFSRMSNEELNKRVEEFIWRLKMQIRLQAARDVD